MTLRSYLRIFRERWKLILTAVSVALLAAIGITVAAPSVYQATAQVFVAPNVAADPLALSQAQYFAQQQVATYADTIDSPDVLKLVRQDLNPGLTESQLAAKIFATAPPQRSLIEVSATDGSPDKAAALANSAATAFAKVTEENTTPADTKTPAVRLKVTKPATAPTSPISPNVLVNILLGLVLGLLAGIALAVARDVLDNRIKDPETLAKVSGSPAMGSVVEDPQTVQNVVATRVSRHSVRAENYRQLRANLQFANVDEHPRVIAVTSSIPGEGKTTVAINLASTLAEAGFSVCLVDTDLRRPAVARMLGLVDGVGLTSVLIHQIELSEALQHAGSSLYVLTSGAIPPNPSEVLASSYVRNVIRSLLDKVDYVVLDTAPLLPVADGSEVAALADGSLLVARYGITTDAQVRRALQTLERVDAPVLGVLLNRVPNRHKNEYGYAYHSQAKDRSPRAPDRVLND